MGKKEHFLYLKRFFNVLGSSTEAIDITYPSQSTSSSVDTGSELDIKWSRLRVTADAIRPHINCTNLFIHAYCIACTVK